MMITSEPEVKFMTPAHKYSYQTDFEEILNDIAKGVIPCGSGQVFPVECNDPNDHLMKRNPGWENTTVYSGGSILNKCLNGMLG